MNGIPGTNRTRKAVETFLTRLGAICSLGGQAFVYLFQRPFQGKMIIGHLYSDGLKSLPVVLLTSIFTGAVLSLQSFYGLQRFGVELFTGSLVGISLTKELIPVLTGLMICGRVGAAYSAEIGTMKVSEQIDALFTFGVDPVQYLVSPRVAALMIMAPLLTLVGDFTGIMGGRFVSAVICKQNPVLFQFQLSTTLELWDVIYGMIKSVFFGLCIAVTGCFFGLHSRGGAKGVGRATTTSVVVSSATILIADFFWSKILPFSIQ